jgi:hypothetical protein
VLADYLFELGQIRAAIEHYRAVIDQKPQDADAQRLFGIALFHTDPIAGLNILRRLSEAAAIEEDSLDFCQDSFGGFSVNMNMKNFNKNPPAESVLKTAALQGRFLLHLVNSLDAPLCEADWDKVPPGPTKISPDEIPSQVAWPPPSPRFTDLVKDADRLGRKCLIRAPEVVDNPRVIRGLGFCVLFLTSFFREKLFRSPDKEGWVASAEFCSFILSLADLRAVVRPILDVVHTRIRTEIAPVFSLKQGERQSPRFAPQNARAADRRIRALMGDVGSAIEGASLYALVQHDISAFGKFRQGDVLEELTNPSVNLRFLGAHGWELFVRPPLDSDDVRRYHVNLGKIWEMVMQQHNSPTSTALPGFVQLVWFLQPLSKYSAEFGHIVMHAYLLAAQGLEMEPVVDGEGELFMKQMVQPNLDALKKVYFEIATKKSVKSTVTPSSLEFWKELPTIRQLFPLFDLGFD